LDPCTCEWQFTQPRNAACTGGLFCAMRAPVSGFTGLLPVVFWFAFAIGPPGKLAPLYTLPGCGVVPPWHCWHSHGARTFSSGATVEPCGVWQFMQSSLAEACDHRNGPRFSAWQLKQVSLMVLFFTSFGPMEPCGLWQSEQATL